MAGPATLAPTLERPAFVADIPDVELFAGLEAEAVFERAERIARGVGVVAVAKAVEVSDDNTEAVEAPAPTFPNLVAALRAAKDGEGVTKEAGRKLVRASTSKEGIEQIYKTGATEVELTVDRDSGIRQNGQSYSDIFAYALAFGSGSEEMMARAQAETRFGARAFEAWRAGLFEENYLLLISRYSDTMTDAEAAEAHLFVGTKTLSAQLMTEVRPGVLKLQSLFIAGAAEPGAERHDKQMAGYVGKHFGLPLAGLDATQMLDAVMVIPKTLLPNGASDLAKLLDAGAGGKTFWGLNQPKQDYEAYYQMCLGRERRLESILDEVDAELIAMADQFSDDDPVAPLRVMTGLLKDRLVPYVIRNYDVDARVYGSEAAPDIRETREALADGDIERAERAEQSAIRKAVATGCPSIESLLSSKKTKEQKPKDKDSKDKKKKKRSKREIMRCVHCPLCNRNGVDAYIDYYPERREKEITCSSCHQSKTYAM